MAFLFDDPQKGAEPGRLTCSACHYSFAVNWPWERLADGCKYFRLEHYFCCPSCKATYEYSLEQSHNFQAIIGASNNGKQYNERLASGKRGGPFRPDFMN